MAAGPGRRRGARRRGPKDGEVEAARGQLAGWARWRRGRGAGAEGDARMTSRSRGSGGRRRVGEAAGDEAPGRRTTGAARAREDEDNGTRGRGGGRGGGEDEPRAAAALGTSI